MSDVQQETIAPEEQALHHEGTEERREEVPPEVLAHRDQGRVMEAFAVALHKKAEKLEQRDRNQEIKKMHHNPASQVPDFYSKKWTGPNSQYTKVNFEPNSRAASH